MGAKMKCPRRAEGVPAGFEKTSDRWVKRDGFKTCSYCGSMKPSDFLDAWDAGGCVGPTDKGYKGYLDTPKGHHKVYFQHFDEADQARFAEIYNAIPPSNKGSETDLGANEAPVPGARIGYPGYFYTLPFFVGLDPT